MTTIKDLIAKLPRRWESYAWKGTSYDIVYGHPRDLLPVPESGDSMSYNHLEVCDWHEADFFKFPATLWGDYVGSTVERSNYQALLVDYLDTFVTAYGDYGSHALFIRADYAEDDAINLVAIGQKLAEEYPLYDEDHYSLLEDALIWESWDSYTRDDVRMALNRLDVENDDIDDDDLRQKFFDIVREQNDYPHCEDATGSVAFPYWDETIEALAIWIAEKKENSEGRIME